MKNSETRERLRALEIKARYLAGSQLTGQWSSNVPGNGLDYKDLREYVQGDDLRRIDWKATARTGRPHLKQFREERSQTIHLALDLSGSMDFDNKKQRAQEIIALLGWTAVLQKDQFALTGFTDKIEYSGPPSRGEMRLWGGVETLFQLDRGSLKTDFKELWKYWFHTLTHRSTCIVVSDFDGEWDPSSLKALCQRHDLWALHISSPWEQGQVNLGLEVFEDAESGQRAWVDSSRPSSRLRTAEEFQSRSRELKQLLHGAGGWYLGLPTNQDYFPLLMKFLHMRETLIHV